MNNNSQFFIRTAAASGALAVILGAFGAHTLKPLLSADLLQAFETGVRYQFYHTIAILFCAVLYRNVHPRYLNVAGWFFLGGIILFCGSLYLIATREVIGLESWKWLGPVTPLGGTLFIAGWLTMAIGAFKNNNAEF